MKNHVFPWVTLFSLTGTVTAVDVDVLVHLHLSEGPLVKSQCFFYLLYLVFKCTEQHRCCVSATSMSVSRSPVHLANTGWCLFLAQHSLFSACRDVSSGSLSLQFSTSPQSVSMLKSAHPQSLVVHILCWYYVNFLSSSVHLLPLISMH